MDNFAFQRKFLSTGSDDRIFQCKHYSRSSEKFLELYKWDIINKILLLSYAFLLENNILFAQILDCRLYSVYSKELESAIFTSIVEICEVIFRDLFYRVW